MQSNVYAFLGTAGTYHNKPKTLLDTADRVQYPYADAYGGLIALSAPKVSETEDHISTAIMFSAAIEITQYFTGRGLCEFDDVFNNTLGACIGFIIWKKLSH